MSDPHAQLDQSVLEMIEHSPTGAVPHTPTYQEALRRLYATHQVYASADHKDGHVTVRSLSGAQAFLPANLAAVRSGQLDASALEANAAVFDRYARSLPPALQARAEAFRAPVIGRAIAHRKHHGPGAAPVIHDPLHCLFLVPGSGPRRGLPGNYLHGAIREILPAEAPSRWVVDMHDAEDSSSSLAVADLAAALDAVEELAASAPFHLAELNALGYVAN